MSEKYSAQNKSLASILGHINAGEIAIPEIQRPFVWESSQVRDVIDFIEVLAETEAAELSEAFWTTGLVQKLETLAATSPYLNVFLAAQICNADRALFTNYYKVSELIKMQGEVHHIFPKKYLVKNGISDKSKYNQIANYTYLDSQVNKAISDDAPCEYFSKAIDAAQRGEAAYGNIFSDEDLRNNMAPNCIPDNIVEMDYSHYDDFLVARRKLMAQKIRDYYYGLI